MLSGGAVLACPTEAVWGLSCDPWNKEAVDRLRAVASRILYASKPFQDLVRELGGQIPAEDNIEASDMQ